MQRRFRALCTLEKKATDPPEERWRVKARENSWQSCSMHGEPPWCIFGTFLCPLIILHPQTTGLEESDVDQSVLQYSIELERREISTYSGGSWIAYLIQNFLFSPKFVLVDVQQHCEFIFKSLKNLDILVIINDSTSSRKHAKEKSKTFFC